MNTTHRISALGTAAVAFAHYLAGMCGVSLASDAPLNVLLICVDDLRPELHCYGVDYVHSPNIDGLAASGRMFTRHFVQAPTCGASRYALLTGRYGGRNNGALFQRAMQLASDPNKLPPSLPAWFRSHGYETVSIGKVSHHPGGMGGSDWNDPTKLEMPQSWDRHLLTAGPWQHPRGWMHGLANGEIRKNASQMAVYQAFDGPDQSYPDGSSIDSAVQQLEQLSDSNRPFFLAVGILRPHLPFGAPLKYLQRYDNAQLPATPHPEKPLHRSTWHRSGEFMKYNRWQRDPNSDDEFAVLVRKHYAACVSFADAMVGRVLTALDASGVSQRTIVVLWGDHGWHLGEHGVWGKHTLFEESLHSPLIIRYPGLKLPGQPCHSIVQSVDIFPTLCQLAKLPIPSKLHGVSLEPQLANPKQPGRPAISYFGKGETIRTDTHRLIVHRDGYVELYERPAGPGPIQNLSGSDPGRVQSMKQVLLDQLN